MKRKLIWIVVLILLFICSYYREVLFRSINALMKGEDFFYAQTMALPFLENWSVRELERLKYFLTAGFAILFAALSLIGFRTSFRKSTAYWCGVLLYASIGFMMLLVLLSSLFAFTFQEVYPALRLMIGWLHSPLIFLLVSAGILAYENANA